ncbi:hypothetical protein TSUD_366180 [Trifolium subterraneum]|uniref:Integrase catalytic domain-containing protein n=1 Tax=Trifolium subterraneum TaxID=3900 RepID=A0A2Z6NY86_TRISU|nr:hypothetical protein TSUD_366180 [Trifolium subterraneum]
MADLNPFQGNKIANLISLKLDDSNFKQWKQQVFGVIRDLDLQKFITNPVIPEKFLTNEDRIAGTINPLHQQWEKHDVLICTWLLSTISDSHMLLSKVVDLTFPWQVLNEIHRHFDTLLTTKARQLRSELRILSKGDRTIAEFIQRVRIMTLVAAISSKSMTVSIDEVESDLLAHESRLEKNKKQSITEAATVNLAQASSPSNSSQNSSTGENFQPNNPSFPSGTSHMDSNGHQGGYDSQRGGRYGRGGGRFGRGNSGVTCQICNKPNHDASICRYRHAPAMPNYGFRPFQYQPPQYPSFFPNSYGYGFAPRSQRPPAPQALLTSGNTNFNNQWWYPDSGASHHVTPDASNLSDAASLPGSDQVLMGNGQVPSITKNLISVSRFAQDNKVFFEFHPTFCLVKSQATSEVLLQGIVGKDGLYRFASPLNSISAINKSSIQCNSVSFSPSSLQASIGHPHHDTLREALKSCNVHIPSKSHHTLCTACCLGKSHRIHAPSSATVYSMPFELVTCDLWGPAPVKSSSGYTYFLTCVDACTRFVWVYPLKLKSETLTKFTHFKSMVELEFGCKIKVVQTNGGGEFRPFTKFLTELGVIHRLTCPHTHHQNGLVERKHRHLVETGLTLLSQANIPLKFWDHAFITAAFLINRLPTPVLNNKSPYYALLHKYPDYKSLKVFGLGYSSVYKGYKCLSPEGRIYISKDVLFNEHKFPYSQLFHSSSLGSSPSGTSSSSSVPLIIPSQTLPTPTQSFPNPTQAPSTPSSSPTTSIPNPTTILHPLPITTIPMSAEPTSPSSLNSAYNQSTTSSPPIQRVKENPDGSIQKYKARLVAKGFHQQAGSDFTETFSPVVKPVTVRTVLIMAITNRWHIQQIDVNNDFLNGILEEEVYMQQPPGFESSDKTMVCKLNKALYGLKQAPRAWFDRLKAALIAFGFTASKCDPSLFMIKTGGLHLIVLVYVDDIIITGNSLPKIQQLISKLNAEFALKQLGTLDYFLGIEVFHLSNGALLLSQTKYIRDLLSKAHMTTANGMATPMVSSLKLSKVGSVPVDNPTLFRSIVGALQYVTLTRPEISYSVNKVCQFLSNPLDDHWKAVKRILRYLSGTLHHGLLLQAAPKDKLLTLIGFSDADWASDPDDRRSTSGACIYVGPNLVSWWSKKQTLVARSSAEAESRSLANLASEILWLQSLLTELGCQFDTPKVLCDNLSTVSLAHNPILHHRTKHMELDIFFVREKVLNKNLVVAHVPAQDQWADVLIKPLSALRDKLRVFNKQCLVRPGSGSPREY